MGELVEKEVCHGRALVAYEGVQDRIGQIAEGCVGRYAAHIDVVTPVGEASGIPLRCLPAEIAPVGDAACDRKTPAFQLQ